MGPSPLAARLATAALRLLRDRGQHWPTWLFLAGRRLGATSHLAVILLAASATAVGVFVYAGTLTHTLDVTLDAKAQTARGSDVVVETVGPPTVPAAYRDRATVVRTLIDSQISSPQVDFVAVDPATFDRGVLWTQLRRRVPRHPAGPARPPDPAAGLPAILVNGGLPAGNSLDFVDPRYPDLKIDPVATADVFPGVSRTRPWWWSPPPRWKVSPNRPVSQVWIDGDAEGISQTFERAGNQVRFVTTTEGVLDQTAFLTVAWTFGFMQALGVLVGLITVGGLLLYLDTGQRSRRVSSPSCAAWVSPESPSPLDRRRGGRGAGGRHPAGRTLGQRGGGPRLPRRSTRCRSCCRHPCSGSRRTCCSAWSWPASRCPGSGPGWCSCPPTGATWWRRPCRGPSRAGRPGDWADGVTISFASVSGRVDARHLRSRPSFEPGVVHAPVGPTGSGKSSFLRVSAGHDRPTSGTIVVAGNVISRLGDRWPAAGPPAPRRLRVPAAGRQPLHLPRRRRAPTGGSPVCGAPTTPRRRLGLLDALGLRPPRPPSGRSSLAASSSASPS